MYRSGELELVKQKHFVRANGYVLKVVSCQGLSR